MYFQIIPRLGSFWIGIHYSHRNRCICINIIPCLTFRIGKTPYVRDPDLFDKVNAKPELRAKENWSITLAHARVNFKAEWYPKIRAAAREGLSRVEIPRDLGKSDPFIKVAHEEGYRFVWSDKVYLDWSRR